MSTEVPATTGAGRWTGRILSGLCAAFLLLDGVMKILALDFVLKASAELGIPEKVIPGLGIVLVTSTLLYVIPKTSVLGAILLTGYLGGAVETHVRTAGPIFPVVFAALFGVLVWLGLYLRCARVRSLIPFRRDAC